LALLAGVWPILAGCGGSAGVPVHPVRGQVLFKERPTPGALVVFRPLADSEETSIYPRGYVDDDGSFELTTHTKDDGAPAGAYAVTVSWRQQSDEDEDAGPNLLPNRYLLPKTSDLRVEVKPGVNELPPFRLRGAGRAT
jgi:hypothetical protein